MKPLTQLWKNCKYSGSVVVVLLAMFILGGEIIRGFSFAMLVGTISGTYSTLL